MGIDKILFTPVPRDGARVLPLEEVPRHSAQILARAPTKNYVQTSALPENEHWHLVSTGPKVMFTLGERALVSGYRAQNPNACTLGTGAYFSARTQGPATLYSDTDIGPESGVDT